MHLVASPLTTSIVSDTTTSEALKNCAARLKRCLCLYIFADTMCMYIIYIYIIEYYIYICVLYIIFEYDCLESRAVV